MQGEGDHRGRGFGTLAVLVISLAGTARAEAAAADTAKTPGLWQALRAAVEAASDALRTGDPVVLVQHAAASALFFALGLGLWLLLRRAIERGLARLESEQAAASTRLLAQARRLESSAKKLLAIAIALATLAAVSRVWGIDPARALLSETALADRVTSAVLVFFAAWILWHLARLSIEFLLLPRSAALAETGSPRARTVVPVLVGTARLAIAFTAALLILSELGLEIGPLLAGAGIAGLALGFGAQSLVKDVLTGIFIILEDSLAVGDVVTVAGHSGTVEQMGVRILRLRDLNGTLHSVPYGAISTVENATRDFAYAVIEIGVAYDADIDAVITAMRDVAAAQRRDADMAPRVLEDIEIFGLDRFADSAVIVKARIKTGPRDRMTVLRDYQARLKRRLDAAGIEIPFPQRTLRLGRDKDGGPPTLRLLADEAEKGEPKG